MFSFRRYGSHYVRGLEEAHTQNAVHYLRLACQVAAAEHTLCRDSGSLAAAGDTVPPTSAPAFVVDEMGCEVLAVDFLGEFSRQRAADGTEQAPTPQEVQQPTALRTRALLKQLVRLSATAAVWNTTTLCTGVGASVAGCGASKQSLAAYLRLHRFLSASVPAFKAKVCVADDIAVEAPAEAPVIPAGLVAVEWQASLEPCEGDESLVTMLFVLGHSEERAEEFGEPMLSKVRVGEAVCRDLHEMFAACFHKLTKRHLLTAGDETTTAGDEGGDASRFDSDLADDWQAALAMAQHHLAAAGQETKLGGGDPACTAEIAGAFAAVFNAASAVELESEAVCCWLRSMLQR